MGAVRQFKLTRLTFLMALLFLINTETILAFPTIYPTGTTIFNEEKAYKGFTLFRSKALNQILLLNMKGQLVHYWEVPDFTMGQIKPLANGNVLLYGKYEDHSIPGVIEIDWDSNVVWRYFDKAHFHPHHDLQRLDNGNTLILYYEYLNVPEISDKPIQDDYIVEVNPAGEVVWEWHTYEHFNEFGFSAEAKSSIYNKGGDWAHTNSMHSLPDNPLQDPRFKKGNILVGQRCTNIIYIIDRDSGQIVWQVGPDDNLTIGQHDVEMIPNGLPGAGNILVFDNGGAAGYPQRHRFYSRAIAISPITKGPVWVYTAKKSGMIENTFFSSAISSVQRLPNGNTLINEGLCGRFFEVTPEGEIVWEFINPFYGEEKDNTVYRIYRVRFGWLPFKQK